MIELKYEIALPIGTIQKIEELKQYSPYRPMLNANVPIFTSPPLIKYTRQSCCILFFLFYS